MDELESRLARCFVAVFPDLSLEQVRTASTESVGSWDSIATVTLLDLVEGEFGVTLDSDDLEHLTSFEQMRDYLRRTAPRSS